MTWHAALTWLAGFRCRRHGHRWIEHYTGTRSMLARCCPDCGCGQVRIANDGGHDRTYGGGPSCESGEDCRHAATRSAPRVSAEAQAIWDAYAAMRPDPRASVEAQAEAIWDAPAGETLAESLARLRAKCDEVERMMEP